MTRYFTKKFKFEPKNCIAVYFSTKIRKIDLGPDPAKILDKSTGSWMGSYFLSATIENVVDQAVFLQKVVVQPTKGLDVIPFHQEEEGLVLNPKEKRAFLF